MLVACEKNVPCKSALRLVPFFFIFFLGGQKKGLDVDAYGLSEPAAILIHVRGPRSHLS